MGSLMPIIHIVNFFSCQTFLNDQIDSYQCDANYTHPPVATDNPYSVVVVLYMGKDSFTEFVYGRTTGNIDAKVEDILPAMVIEDRKKFNRFVN